MPHQHTSRTVQETQLIGPEVHLGANCALSSLKLKFCWDSEYQYEPPFPWRLTHFGWGHLGTGPRSSTQITRVTKGSTKGIALLQWLLLHPLLALGRRAPTLATPASKGHRCLFWGTHHLPIASTSDKLRVLRTSSLTLPCVTPGRPQSAWASSTAARPQVVLFF